MKEKPKTEDQAAVEAEVVDQAAGTNPEICFNPEEMLQTMTLLEEKNRLLEELTDRHKRLQADFDNFRRRTKIEKEELAQVITESIVMKLLPVIDNFERARSNGSNQDPTAIREGVELIYKQFITTLEKLDIRSIDAVGSAFDPNLHEAVMTAPDENSPDGTILEEFQRGYTLGSKAIRPSMVKVSTHC